VRLVHSWAAARVPGLPIRDCARGCTNCDQSRPMMGAIDMTSKTFFERLYLVLGLQKNAPRVNCPYSPTIPTVHSTTISRFMCNFFPRMPPHFFGHHDSPSNLAKSQRVVFPTHSKSVWYTTHSRKKLCVVHLNFENRSLKFGEMGVGQCGRRL